MYWRENLINTGRSLISVGWIWRDVPSWLDQRRCSEQRTCYNQFKRIKKAAEIINGEMLVPCKTF
jgi:hypothetical protein